MTLITKIATGRGAGLTTVIRCRASVPRAPPAQTSRTLRGGTARDLLELSGARRGGSGFTRSSPTERSSGAPGPVQQSGLRRRGEPVGRGGTVDHARTGSRTLGGDAERKPGRRRLPPAPARRSRCGTVTVLGRLSATLAVFRRAGDGLYPVPVRPPDWFDDDLVGIPKYPGKTNEQFTRLLVNVTAASATRELGADAVILDPLCGRGTTLSTGWTLGYDVAGVEADRTAVEAYDAFLRGYLRRKRIKHHAEFVPVRREGRSLGRRLSVTATPEAGETAAVPHRLHRRHPAVGGAVRAAAVRPGDCRPAVRDRARQSRSRRGQDRRVVDLVEEALPVWAGQLKRGGALGLSWNTYTMTRDRLSRIATEAGLRVCTGASYLRLGHRVDASIHRDVLVAVNDSASAPGRTTKLSWYDGRRRGGTPTSRPSCRPGSPSSLATRCPRRTARR